MIAYDKAQSKLDTERAYLDMCKREMTHAHDRAQHSYWWGEVTKAERRISEYERELATARVYNKALDNLTHTI